MILLDSILGKGNYFRLDLQLLILYIALAVFNGVLAAIAFSQLVRIHMRNQQIGWTRQKVLHLMIGCSNLGYFLYFTSTLIATCKQWFCWFSVCGFILMAYPKVLLLAAFLLVLSFCYTLRAFCMAICLKKKQLLLQNHFNKIFLYHHFLPNWCTETIVSVFLQMLTSL